MYSELVLKSILSECDEKKSFTQLAKEADEQKQGSLATFLSKLNISKKLDDLKEYATKVFSDPAQLKKIIGIASTSAGSIGAILGSFRIISGYLADREAGRPFIVNYKEAVITAVSLACLIAGIILIATQKAAAAESALQNLIGFKEEDEVVAPKKDFKAKIGDVKTQVQTKVKNTQVEIDAKWEEIKARAIKIFASIQKVMVGVIGSFKEKILGVKNWAELKNPQAMWKAIGALAVLLLMRTLFIVYKMKQTAAEGPLSIWALIKKAAIHFGGSVLVALAIVTVASGIVYIVDQKKKGKETPEGEKVEKEEKPKADVTKGPAATKPEELAKKENAKNELDKQKGSSTLQKLGIKKK
jgi:hypothetical protein